MNKYVELYTDGACFGNPGPGGYGAILRYNSCEKKLSGGFKLTTNNRMELLAAIIGLTQLKQKCQIIITTDSQYVRNGITKWITKWKQQQWRTANKNPVKNIDLWQQLDALCQQHQVHWRWIKGHSGHIDNERCDALAKAAANAKLAIDKGYIASK